MASLRNLAVGIVRARGHRNIAAAMRYYARDATRLLPLLGITGSRPALGQVVEACTTVALGAPG